MHYITITHYHYPHLWLVPYGGVNEEANKGLSCPRPEFGSSSDISQLLLHHHIGIFSCRRYKHYFSQTEMFTSNVQLGYPYPKDG